MDHGRERRNRGRLLDFHQRGPGSAGDMDSGGKFGRRRSPCERTRHHPRDPFLS